MPKMAAETTSWKVSDMHSAVELVSLQVSNNGEWFVKLPGTVGCNGGQCMLL